MQIAINTISWGKDYRDWGAMFSAISQVGFRGVVLSQTIGKPHIEESILAELDSRGLELVGVASGDLEEKLAFARTSCLELRQTCVPFITTFEWTSELEKRLNVASIESNAPKVPIALHTHMFKSVQTFSEAELLMGKYPYLTLLPDCGHLTVAGEDVIRVVNHFLHRLAAVCLKDWTPDFGRSLPFYSQGFVELGTGHVPLPAILRALQHVRYNGWLVVEQERSTDPVRSALQSLKWLNEQDV